MEIGPRATTSGIHRTFVVTKLDLDGGDMNVTTINIRSVKLHTPEPLHHATDGYGGERDAAATMPNTGDTTITDPVLIRFFKSPAPEPLNDEAFRVAVSQPMTRTTKPDALSIDIFFWVSGAVLFRPYDGCIYCEDASTSYNSSNNSTSSKYPIYYISSFINSFTVSVYSTAKL